MCVFDDMSCLLAMRSVDGEVSISDVPGDVHHFLHFPLFFNLVGCNQSVCSPPDLKLLGIRKLNGKGGYLCVAEFIETQC